MKSKETASFILSSALLCPCCMEHIPFPEGNEGNTLMNVKVETSASPLPRSVEAFAGQMDYETMARSIQIFIYDAQGHLEAYSCTDGEDGGNTQFTVTSGDKTVWAAVNGPDLSEEAGAATMDAIGQVQADLSQNSITSGFIMSGSAECRIPAGGGSVSVPVRRLVSRIALKKITSRLPQRYGRLAVRNVFLANVAGNQNLSGTAPAETWYNMAGRADSSSGKTMPVDGIGSPASCPELTFADISQELNEGESFCPSIPLLLYCYPNSCGTDATGWSIPFTARKTRLVVSAEIAGILCYYPVTIDFPERNSTYTVELCITGPGSTDPDIPVDKGAISAIVSILDWNEGAAYCETI